MEFILKTTILTTTVSWLKHSWDNILKLNLRRDNKTGVFRVSSERFIKNMN